MTSSFTPAANSFTVTDPPKWRPKLKPGFFYIGGLEHYLYARKATFWLQELTWSVLRLSNTPTAVSAVEVEGMALDQKRVYPPFDEEHYNWFVKGDLLYVRHIQPLTYATYWSSLLYDSSYWGTSDWLFRYEPDTEFRIGYSYVEYNSSTDQFDTKTAVEYIKLSAGEEQMYMPVMPPAGSPVVVTDDSIGLRDQRDFAVEFSIDSTEREYLGYQLKFNNYQNELVNPSFEISATGSPEEPKGWIMAPTGLVFRRRSDAFHGEFSLSTEGTGVAIQEIAIDPRERMAFSVYARGRGATQSVAGIGLDFIDPTGAILSTGGVGIGIEPGYLNVSSYTKTATAAHSDDWDRVLVTIGPSVDTQVYPWGQPEVYAPTGAVALQVKLYADAGVVEFDGAQLEVAPTGTQFAYVDPFSTVEFETAGDRMFYVDPALDAPFQAWDLDLNPLQQDWMQGFLALERVSEASDWKLGGGQDFLILPRSGEIGVWDTTGNAPETELGYQKMVELRWDVTKPSTVLGHSLARIPLWGFRDTDYVANSSFLTYTGGLLNYPSVYAPGLSQKYVADQTAWTEIFEFLCTGANTTHDGVVFTNVREAVAQYGAGWVNGAIQTGAALYGGGDFVGVHDPQLCIGTGEHQGATGTAALADYLLLDGLSRDKATLRLREWHERYRSIKQLVDTSNFAWDVGNRDMYLGALDYETDVTPDTGFGMPDLHGRKAFKAFANESYLLHGMQTPEGQFIPGPTDVHVPLGLNEPWPTGTFPQTKFGRKHVPYAQTAGRGKLLRKAYFSLENPAYDPEPHPPTLPKEPSIATIRALEDSYLDDDLNMRMLCRTGEAARFSATFVDVNSNPVVGYPVLAGTPTGGVNPTVGFTDHRGRFFGTFTAPVTPTGEAVSRVYVASRYPGTGLMAFMDVDVV